MPERVNFICAISENLTTTISKAWVMEVLAELDVGQVTEVLTLDTLSGAERSGSWTDVTCETLKNDELLIVHSGPVLHTTTNGPTFVFSRRSAGWSITVSLEQAAIECLGISGARLLGRIAGASSEVFSEAALAWGNELDLFEAGERVAFRTSGDLRELCEAWHRDWRCRATMFIRSLSS